MSSLTPMTARTPADALSERLRNTPGPAEPCRDLKLIRRVERGLQQLPDQRRTET